MKDAKEISQTLIEKYSDITLFALVPNLFGAKVAVEQGMNLIAYVTSVSESHNKANTNKTVQESMNEFQQMKENFPDL